HDVVEKALRRVALYPPINFALEGVLGALDPRPTRRLVGDIDDLLGTSGRAADLDVNTAGPPEAKDLPEDVPLTCPAVGFVVHRVVAGCAWRRLAAQHEPQFLGGRGGVCLGVRAVDRQVPEVHLPVVVGRVGVWRPGYLPDRHALRDAVRQGPACLVEAVELLQVTDRVDGR